MDTWNNNHVIYNDTGLYNFFRIIRFLEPYLIPAGTDWPTKYVSFYAEHTKSQHTYNTGY